MSFQLKQFKESGGHIHLIGCAGAGTQPLASIFLDLGFPCSGSDLISTPQTEKLKQRGMKVFSGHSAVNLPPESVPLLVVYTSAATEENPEIHEARRRGCPMMKRGEALAHIGTLFQHTVAVAGSHGKTSVTTLIAHILIRLGRNPGFLIGGNVPGWEESGRAGDKTLFVTEVDESDSTNALFQAKTAVVTNVEDDHSWSVGGDDALFRSFITFGNRAETLIYVGGANPDRLFSGTAAKAVRIEPEAFRRHENYPSHWGGFQKINAYTAVTAVRSVLGNDVSEIDLWNAADSFPGVERRMSLRLDTGTYRIIEDYAHHPTELRASLAALRETNPERRMIVVFQPHRFARLKKYQSEFATILREQCDEIILPPVFAAWTDQSDTDSNTLAALIGSKARAWNDSWEVIAEKTAQLLHPGDLIAVIGAGDVKEIIPHLKRILPDR